MGHYILVLYWYLLMSQKLKSQKLGGDVKYPATSAEDDAAASALLEWLATHIDKFTYAELPVWLSAGVYSGGDGAGWMGRGHLGRRGVGRRRR